MLKVQEKTAKAQISVQRIITESKRTEIIQGEQLQNCENSPSL